MTEYMRGYLAGIKYIADLARINHEIFTAHEISAEPRILIKEKGPESSDPEPINCALCGSRKWCICLPL